VPTWSRQSISNMKRVLIIGVLALLIIPSVSRGIESAFASTPLPAPTGYVNDFAGVLSAEANAALENELTAFNASTTNEVAVVTVNSLNGDYIEHYAEQLFKMWGIGTEKNDNGVLLILAINDHKLRIEVGYGLEGALPDSVAASIIADMTPLLKGNDYDGAITLGAEEIMAATQGEYVASTASDGIDAGIILNLLIFGFVVLSWIVAILARSKSYWAGGAVGAVAGLIISSIFGWWLVGGLVATGVLAAVGLILDFAVSSAYKEAKSSGITPPWWTGGGSWGGGGSSSGGSFGGFGGGSSGGGGASGGW
jgi:uncharacterized protein